MIGVLKRKRGTPNKHFEGVKFPLKLAKTISTIFEVVSDRSRHDGQRREEKPKQLNL